jgi:putative hemolysin
MTALSRAGHPLISLLGAVTDGVIQVVRLGRPTEPAVTDEDVRALVAQGRASGEIHAVEQEILDRALRLGETTAASVMTPRTDIDWVPAGEPPERLRPRLRAHPHRYVVVADGTVDQVIGVARTEDLLGQLLEGRPLDWRRCSAPRSTSRRPRPSPGCWRCSARAAGASPSSWTSSGAWPGSSP